jgi:diguanylate cyclase (GGDEF)-like protein/PAS domain S-box-containing protein
LSPFLKGSIARGLAIWFLLLSGVAAVSVGWMLLDSFEGVHKATLLKTLNGVADKKVDQISAYFNERIQDVETYSETILVKEAMADYARAYGDPEAYLSLDARFHPVFKDYLERTGYYDLFLISPSGEVVYTVARESDYATNILTGSYRETGLAAVTRQALAQLGTGLSYFEYYQPSLEHAAFLATPVIEGGRLLGILALQLDTDQVMAVATDVAGLGETGETMAAMRGADGKMLMTAPLRYMPEPAFTRTYDAQDAGLETLRQALQGESGSGFSLDYRGEKVVAAWRYLAYLDWGMTVKIDLREGMREVYAARRNLMIFALFCGLITVMLAVIAARSITRPLGELTKIAGEIAAGNLEHRAHVGQDNEVGRLAMAFNTMSVNLRNSYQELSEYQGQLEQRVLERTAELHKAIASLRLASAVVDNTSEGIVVTDASNTIIEVNQAYCNITGYEREELLGRNPSINKSDFHDAAFYQSMWTDLLEKGSWSGEIWDRRKDGSIFPKWLSINAIKDEADVVENYVGVFTDITKIKETERKLEELAYYDPLTGLPNRTLFHDRLRREMANSDRTGNKAALMFIDLDRFKYVNDTLGHKAGDALLIQVSKQLADGVRETDTVARLGGDEFTVILGGLSDTLNVGRIAQGYIERMQQPFQIEGQEVYVGASIGICIYPDDGEDEETLNKNADIAMYEAKSAGRGQFHFFHPGMDAANSQRMILEGNLRRALVENQLRVFYQPKVDLASNTIVGMEALVRWMHPEDGLISPADFVPIAEENGMIVMIDQFVMREACRQIRLWRQEGASYRVAVNLSALQFKQKNLVEYIEDLLAEHELDPAALELEITESAIMDDPASAAQLITKLRKIGLYISVDDFGTGYSSLAYLKKFPINALKIDQSFVRDLTWDSDDAAIVRSIITLSASLNLGVVAEGVETLEQKAFLLEHGCRLVQGYLFSKPLPADEMTAFLEKGLA